MQSRLGLVGSVCWERQRGGVAFVVMATFTINKIKIKIELEEKSDSAGKTNDEARDTFQRWMFKLQTPRRV